MTKKEIIAMAQEARDQVSKELPPNMFDLDLFYERFVALVRADEREALIEITQALLRDDPFDATASAIQLAIRARGNT